MNFKDMFKSKAEKAEANAKARQMLRDKQESRKTEAVVMDRMLRNLDLGALGPYYNRSQVAHSDAGGIEPKHPLPWDMPREGFERMVDTGEFDDPRIPAQLRDDYGMLRPDTHKNMDTILKAMELDQIRSSMKRGIGNLKGENVDYTPEEGY